MNGPQARLLPDGRRLHLNHGPIDLVIEAFGGRDEVAAAYRQARDRFETVLPDLVGELASLRKPVRLPRWVPDGPVARRMMDATWPHREVFVTPMAAVAGAVADEIVAALVRGRNIDRAYVNNSGDIAIHLAEGHALRLGVVGELFRPEVTGVAEISHAMPVRGVATSGWKGRSWSFGIADAVTVLARSAAEADVAATLIGNAVNADHPEIVRRPANEVDDQTDLGARLVTVEVGDIDRATVEAALASGSACAEAFLAAGFICSAAITLRGETRIVSSGGKNAGNAHLKVD